MPLNPISPAFIGVPVQGPPGPPGSGSGGGTTTVGSYTQPVHNATVSVTLADASGVTLLGAVTVTDPTAGNQYYTCTAVAGSVATLLNYSPGNTTSGTIAAGSKVTFGGPGAGIGATAINEGQTQVIVGGVLKPVGHARVYNVQSYLLPTDSGDLSLSLQRAADAALAAGGGTVQIPNAATYYTYHPVVVGQGVTVQGESKVGSNVAGLFYGPAFIGMSSPNPSAPTLQVHSGISFLRGSSTDINAPWICLSDAAPSSLKGKSVLSVECFVYSPSGQTGTHALFFSKGQRGSRPQDFSQAFYVSLGASGAIGASLHTSAAGGSSTIGGGGFTQPNYGYKNAITVTVASSTGAVVGEYMTTMAIAPVTITGAVSSGGLIHITATAHGRSNGDRVTIAGVTGTTEANGNWLVTNATTNNFDLAGSTFTNAYVSGGTVCLGSTWLIRAVPNGTSITIQNIRPTPTGIPNVPPGTSIANGIAITYSGAAVLNFSGAIPNAPAQPTKIEFSYDGANIGLWAGPAGGTCTFLGRAACAGVIIQNHWETFCLANDVSVPFAGTYYGVPDIDYASPRISLNVRHSPTTGANYTAESSQLASDSSSLLTIDFSTLYRGSFVQGNTWSDPFGWSGNSWFFLRNHNLNNVNNVSFKSLSFGGAGPGLLLESVLKFNIEDIGLATAAGVFIDNNCYPGIVEHLDIQTFAHVDVNGLPVWNSYSMSLTNNVIFCSSRSTSIACASQTAILVSTSAADFNNVYAAGLGGAVGVYVNEAGALRYSTAFHGGSVGDEGGSWDEAVFWLYGAANGTQAPSANTFTTNDLNAQSTTHQGTEAYHVDGLDQVAIGGTIDVTTNAVGLAVVKTPSCGLRFTATGSNIGGNIVDATQAALVSAPEYEGCEMVITPGNTTVSITGAANAGGLIRITATAHGRSNGDWVTIASVGGTTEANGTWQLANVATNTFDLVGSAFVHAYTSGGTSTQDILISINDSLWGTYRVVAGTNTTTVNIQRPYLTGRQFTLINDNAQTMTYRRPGGGGTGATVASTHSSRVLEKVAANDVVLVG